MNTKKLKSLLVLVLIFLLIGFPFTVVHLIAAPDEVHITSLQRIVAAIADFFGPWGIAIVRLVDFPNAGFRSFSWISAVVLTLIGALLSLV